MFSTIQKGLVIDARGRIEAGTERFICCAINSAVQTIGEASYEVRMLACRGLKEQIEFGIDEYSCLELWLFSETGIYPEDLQDTARDIWKTYAFAGWNTPLSRDAFNNLCRMARLAWIDRALETGVLA